jgi:hypothetical protein
MTCDFPVPPIPPTYIINCSDPMWQEDNLSRQSLNYGGDNRPLPLEPAPIGKA